MGKSLVIVESPAKAKTISKILGNDYIVKASFGHIRDLPKKEIGINLETFDPEYTIMPDKKKIVNEFKELSNSVDTIYFATDEDREGEGISFHLAKILKQPFNKKNRITFHEITKTAIINAINNPRLIDTNIADSYQTRRLMDRIVGFKLSPLLWKYLKGLSVGLSAGRVQSVAVKLIGEKEKEINEKLENSKETYYKVNGDFYNDNKIELSGILSPQLEKDDKDKFIEKIKKAQFIIKTLSETEENRNPQPPYTTSTLQQDATVKLKITTKMVMAFAQKLYENGLITYMRTDSVNLCDEILQKIKEYIITEYSPEYSRLFKYKTKSKNAQEAHEAIRPTNISILSPDETKFDKKEIELYKLIWKRTIQSQMSPAIYKIYQIILSISNYSKYQFECRNDVLTFDGWKILDKSNKKNTEESSEENLSPDFTENFKFLKENDIFNKNNIKLEEMYPTLPPRYTESSLVKKLEVEGIGRPSTYASIISHIIEKNYVEKKDFEGIKKDTSIITINKKNEIKEKKKTQTIGNEKQKITITPIGIEIITFLEEHFPDIMDYKFTYNFEKYLDKIATGKYQWKDILGKFWETISPKITELENNNTGIKYFGGTKQQKDIITLGEYKSKNIILREAKYGPVIQYGTQKDDVKFVKIPKDLLATWKELDFDTVKQIIKNEANTNISNENITNELKVYSGQYGKYIRYNNKNIGLKKLGFNDYEKDTINIELIKDKLSNVN